MTAQGPTPPPAEGRRGSAREVGAAVLPPRGREAFAFLGLGSNVGDRLETLQSAVDLLENRPGIRVDAVSSVYETAPVGGPEQGPFLNLVVRVATRRSPQRLLAACQAVEQALGRVRVERWGPRTIDVDILLYERRRVLTRQLEVPHPRLPERPFALVPLLEVGHAEALPDGRTIASLLAALAPIDGVTMVGAQVRPPGEAGPSREPST